MQEGKIHDNVRKTAYIALMSALLCVLCPVSVPIGPVPVSLGVFAVYLISYVLTPLQAALCCVVYLLLGAAGLPVFAGYQAGVMRVIGPTGGYLAGYLPLAFLTAWGVRTSYRRCRAAEAEEDARETDAAANSKNTGIHTHVRRILLQSAAMLAGLFVLYVLGTAWFVFAMEGMTVMSALGVCVFPFIPFDLLKIAAALVAGNALYTALVRANLLAPAAHS
ncbi:MAG: biotin transporter BioY [Lachnospiraceae bacterium]|nr:biotin transporter BioY [Lachnospiraceae bacterium]